MGIPPIVTKILPVLAPVLVKVVEGIGKAAKHAWNKITGKDEKQDEIAQQKGVNPEKNTADDIAELNRLLAEYRQGIASAGDNLEREMIAECSIMLQEIMDVFESCNQELKILRADSVKRKFNKLSRNLKGTFSEYVRKRISLDDPECVRVLKLPAGDLKSERLQEMKQNVFIDAGNEIIQEIRDAVQDFSDTVEDAFEDHLERAEDKIQEKTSAFEQLMQNHDADAQETEKVMINADYLTAICSYASELL